MLALTCSLKPSPAPSSTDLLAQQLLDALAAHGATGELVRVVDHDVRPGVEADMGDGDAWPALREKMLAADILVVATPTWMGQHSSVAHESSSASTPSCPTPTRTASRGPTGRSPPPSSSGTRTAPTPSAPSLFQTLNDVGFTIPAGGVTYWNGEAMHTTDYQDLDATPEKTQSTTATLAANAAHLARLLKGTAYPPA